LKKSGFSFVELIVVFGIIGLALSMGFIHFRNTADSAMKMTSSLNLHMEMGRAVSKLTENILEGTELVKPTEGTTLSFLVLKDVLNQTRLFFLEATSNNPAGLFDLVMYKNTYSGKYDPKERKVLFGNVKNINFTTISPGLIIVNFIIGDPQGREVSSLVEIPLKNLATLED